MEGVNLRVTKWLVVLALVGLLAACSGTPKPPETVEKTMVFGQTLAGYAKYLGNVEIVFLGQGTRFTTRSDPEGRFQLQLPPGIYRVLANAEGYAESAIDGLTLGPEGVAHLTLRLYPAFYPDWPTRAPRVLLEVEGNRYRVQVETAAPFKVAFLAVGQEPGYPFAAENQRVFYHPPDPGWRSLEGMLAPHYGKTYLYFLVYDQNNNRTLALASLDRKPEITPPPPTELQAVQNLSPIAVTLPRELYALSDPAGAFQIVRIRWDPYSWPEAAVGRPHGFRVWRSTLGEETLIGTVSGDQTSFFDRGLAGIWNQPVAYRVVPYIMDTKGPVATTEVRPLPPFRVFGLKPKHGDRVSPTPDFSWEISQKVSDHHYYYPTLWNTVTGKEVQTIAPKGFTDKTHLSFDETTLHPLWPGRAYGFEVSIAFAVDSKENPTAYSLALDRYGQLLGIPLRGEFNLFEVVP